MHKKAEEYLNHYEIGLNHQQIGRLYDRSASSVALALKTHPRYPQVVRSNGNPQRDPDLKQRVMKLYCEERGGLNEIARLVRIRTANVRQILRDAGVEIRTQSDQQSGHKNPSWRGGRTIVGGYWYVYSPTHPLRTRSGYVLEHRLVMEKALGRRLERLEVVHHRDGNTQNNTLENLQLFPSNGRHLAVTTQGKPHQVSEAGRRRISESTKGSWRLGRIRPYPRSGAPA